MNALARQSPVTLLLAIVAGTGLLALLLTILPTTVWISEPPRDAPRAIAIPAVDPRPFEDYAAILDRPLFNDGRRKDAPAAAAGSGQLPPLSDYRLAGVVISKDVRIALVERRQGKQIVVLHPGDALDGRHVDDVTADGLTLSSSEGPELLSLPKGKAGGWSIVKDPPISP